MKKTHYDALGLKRDATPEEIKDAYRRLRGGLHPDREGGDTEAMAAVNAAYTVLSDPEQRAAYDQSLPDASRVAAEAVQGLLAKFLEEDGDPIAASDKEIGAVMERTAATKAHAKAAIKRLRRHLTKLKFKGSGENVAAKLIKQKLIDRADELEHCDLMMEVFGRARALLRGYEYEPEPQPKPEPDYRYQTDMVRLMGWLGGLPR